MENYKQTIVITGASSGIGKATALFLDKLGFKVYAGVRKETDAQALEKEASENLCPIYLDVGDASTIRNAVNTIEKDAEIGTLGLVNNAGVSINAPLEMASSEKIKELFNVNVIGLLELTKALLPFIRESKGRIINISSGHGLLALPDKSVYAASKFAVEAITDSLRLELHPFDIYVSSIVVGKVDTAVLEKIIADREKTVAATPPEIVKLYSPLLEYFDQEVKGIPGIPAVEVSKIVYKALIDNPPQTQYLVGPGAKKMKNLARLPVRLRDRLMCKALYG
jgi:short-subunit dehydrogenase